MHERSLISLNACDTKKLTSFSLWVREWDTAYSRHMFSMKKVSVCLSIYVPVGLPTPCGGILTVSGFLLAWLSMGFPMALPCVEHPCLPGVLFLGCSPHLLPNLWVPLLSLSVLPGFWCNLKRWRSCFLVGAIPRCHGTRAINISVPAVGISRLPQFWGSKTRLLKVSIFGEKFGKGIFLRPLYWKGDFSFFRGSVWAAGQTQC